MVIFFAIALMLMPATMIGFGLLWRKNPPGKINMAYGYRTTWSMKSQETWDFAHKYAAKIWLNTGIPLAVISIALLLVFRNADKDKLGQVVTIINAVQVIGLLLPIAPTEIALRNRFDKNGRRKVDNE